MAAGVSWAGAGGGAMRSGRAWGVVLISEGSMPGMAGAWGAAAEGGAGAASGVPGAGPSPGPLSVEAGRSGTVRETSLHRRPRRLLRGLAQPLHVLLVDAGHALLREALRDLVAEVFVGRHRRLFLGDDAHDAEAVLGA